MALERQKSPRFRGNNKGVSLTVVKTQKYKRVMQLIQQVSQERIHPVESKVICHYVG